MTPAKAAKHGPSVRLFGRRFPRKKHKVFVIGRNKTGTTSMAAALRELGYLVGKQEEAELLIDDWGRGDFSRIIDHCRTADAFQDIPFALPGTYEAVDAAFPGSKFILTVRKDAQTWYDSLTRFHTGIVGKDRLPTPDDLKEFGYREPGWIWKTHRLVYGIDESTLYDPRIYMEHYENYNRTVQDYFAGRPDDFLTLNVGDADAVQRLCEFLGTRKKLASMPRLNKS
ncbi:P-loop containing nucleotide triphosphate hydrolase [Haloferula helveola]|uniref:P-loop containing nucleotide triphosphate hydrolase n=1 Tax=Haloferula helveola TaxID=490095 RepID=A0ABM7RHK6_9BACT|nr:P-loop containing nucleotide triphosphate hydrolase [Haloferula helveola]